MCSRAGCCTLLWPNTIQRWLRFKDDAYCSKECFKRAWKLNAKSSLDLDTASESMLWEGARVTVHSLKRAAEHNGVYGETGALNESSARWSVHIEPDGRVLAIKPDNLALVCSRKGCCVRLKPPLHHCAQCKAVAYCTEECREQACKEGHKCTNVPERALSARRSPQPTARQQHVLDKVMEVYEQQDWKRLALLEDEALAVAKELRDAQPQRAYVIYGILADCYKLQRQVGKAREMREEAEAIAQAGDQDEEAGTAFPYLAKVCSVCPLFV